MQGCRLVSLYFELLPECYKCLVECRVYGFLAEILVGDVPVQSTVGFEICNETGFHATVVHGLFGSLVPNESNRLGERQWCAFNVTIWQVFVTVNSHRAVEVSSNRMLESSVSVYYRARS